MSPERSALLEEAPLLAQWRMSSRWVWKERRSWDAGRYAIVMGTDEKGHVDGERRMESATEGAREINQETGMHTDGETKRRGPPLGDRDRERERL